MIGLAVATGAAIAVVLLVPWFTAQPVAPLRAQQAFRDAKGVPMLDSVDDLLAIIWPSGERRTSSIRSSSGRRSRSLPSRYSAAIWTPRVRSGVVFGSLGVIGTVVALNVNLSLIAAQYLVLAAPYFVIVAGAGFSVLAESCWPKSKRCSSRPWRPPWCRSQRARRVRCTSRADSRKGPKCSAPRSTGFETEASQSGPKTPTTAWCSQVLPHRWVGMRSVPCRPGGRSRSRSRSMNGSERESRVHEDPKTVFLVDIFRGKREPASEVFDANDEYLELVAVAGTPDDGFRKYVRVFEVDECVLDGSCP